MLAYSIGLSGLTASQTALDIEGQNISNANTPGYHRQVADLTAALPSQEGGLSIGSGVDVTTIERLRSALVENAVTGNTSATGATTAQLNLLRQVQTAIAPSSGSLNDLLGKFFGQLTTLAATPDDPTARRTMLNSASNLSNGLQSLSSGLKQLSQNVDTQLSQDVSQINNLTSEIAKLNGQIGRLMAAGTAPNDQLDQRDQLINQLAGLVNVQTVDQGSGETSVLVAGQTLVQGDQAVTLNYSVDKGGTATIAADGLPPLTASGGSVAGLLQVHNQILPAYQDQVDALAHQLIQNVDEVQATGLGLNGPSTSLSGTRSVTSATVPLAQAGLAFPAHAGSLYVSVTNLATGQRTINKVAIDPATQSLQDVAAALSSIPHLQGLVNSQSGTLNIVAQQGYGFSFAAQLATTPDTQAITGTTTPEIGGAYTGATNGVLTYDVVGSGTVGVSPNLTLNVKDAARNAVASLNIGQGYSPGSALQVGNGVTVQLSSGTANNGDSFTMSEVANSDTAGLLPALGLNTFFQGENAADFAVRPDLLTDPSGFSASQNGQPGDSSNVQKMAALQDALLANGTQTLGQSYGSLVGDVGGRVQSLTQQQTGLQLVGQSLQTQQQSVSGVDPNQELVQLVQSQQSYQLAAHYISVLDQTMVSLLAIT